ncbi:MAG: PucR family transcriptional regulator [Clostridiales bacterium]|nr:PucR family transcriptional regulator [Clostridiales bacterium]
MKQEENKTKNNCEKEENSLKIGNALKVIPLNEIILSVPTAILEKYLALHDMRALVKIFGDSEMMDTAESFFQNNLNVSQTAQALYMHRNTLMYRLNKIKKLTGLDIKNFDMALTFEILALIYKHKWSNNELKNK